MAQKDPLKDVIDAIFVVQSAHFKRLLQGKKIDSQDRGRLRKYFFYHPASKHLTKLEGKERHVTEVGRMVHSYVSELKSIEIFNTAQPEQLLELYARANYPGLFIESKDMKYLKSLKKKGFLQGRSGEKLTQSSVRRVIESGQGTTRFLTENALKLVNHSDKVFNLMSYYSASKCIFKGIDEAHRFWLNQFALSATGLTTNQNSRPCSAKSNP